jgi:hypothetical protein
VLKATAFLTPHKVELGTSSDSALSNVTTTSNGNQDYITGGYTG